MGIYEAVEALGMKRYGWVWAALAAVAAAGLLWKTQEVCAGVRTGLLNCANVLIPSLFPFMILAGLISRTSAGPLLSRCVGLITRPMGLPERLGSVLLMSFVGGFPVGAQMLSEMFARREISRDTAERALCFCVNAGPSFLISAVGAGMLGSRTAGLVLLGAQLLSSLTVGFLHFHGGNIRLPPVLQTPSKDAFVESVRGAAAGMIGICAFVVAFSALAALLDAFGVFRLLTGVLASFFPALGERFFSAALTGLLEVTNGCIAAAGLHTFQGFVLCAFLVSFSSISIIFQVKSCFPTETEISFGKFYRSRLLHGGITSLLAALGYRLIPPAELAAGAMVSRPVPQATPNMLFTCACLIAMCTILILPQRGRIHN